MMLRPFYFEPHGKDSGMKKILFIALILVNLTNAQTDFNKGFGEYTFGSSFASIVQKLTKKHFVSIKAEHKDSWKTVFDHSYVILTCTIFDSLETVVPGELFSFEFFNDSLFVINLGGSGSFERYLDGQLSFIRQTETSLFVQPHDKYPKDSEGFHSIDQVRIRFTEADNPRYEIRLKSIDHEYLEIEKKVRQLQNGGLHWDQIKG